MSALTKEQADELRTLHTGVVRAAQRYGMYMTAANERRLDSAEEAFLRFLENGLSSIKRAKQQCT